LAHLARPAAILDESPFVLLWLEQPNIAVLETTERHWEILRTMIDEGQARGPLVMDAHLAALAIEHGATLCTNDLDFRRFDGLDLEFPLRS
jgi:predicted nucleic acid-binding protein